MSGADSSAPEPPSHVGAALRVHTMRPFNEGRRSQFLLFAALYLIAVIYVSIAPFHYVRVDQMQAWRDLLSVTFSRYDYAEQRADLMGNVFVPVPLAFALAAVFRRESSLISRWVGSLVALVISFILIVAIKYLQLFFPPRTVDLNYIVAQTTGAFIGVLLWAILRQRLSRFAAAIHFGGRGALIASLTAYTTALIVFTYFPFNLVLNAEDFFTRLEQVHHTVLALPGSGRPSLQRLVLMCLELLSTVPVGVLLALVWRDAMSLTRATIVGFLLSGLLFLAGLIFVDFVPTVSAIPTHTAGVILGALCIRWLQRRQAPQFERLLRIALRWLVLPYLMLVFLLNDLASRDWRSPETALAEVDWIWTLPLVRHYFVSKAAAAASTVARSVMYAPVGAIVWAYRGPRAWLAALCGGGLALAMEIGRFFKPGLAPDSTNIIIAAAVAAVVAAFMPRALLWIGGAQPRSGDPQPSQSLVEISSPLIDGGKTSTQAGFLRITAGVAAAVLAFAIIAYHAIAPAALAIGGIAYAAALWRRPSCWLVLLPGATVVVNLAPWTGWLYVGESDVLFLLTIAVLLPRCHVQRDDLRLGWMTVLVVGFYVAYCFFAIWRGYTFAGGAPGTNPYLSPENAFRVGKGVIEPLLLLPFLAHAWRTERDAHALFSAGMTVALLAVALTVMFERILFVGLFDFDSGYRAAGPFGGMHIGGGFIGAFLALTLPFAAVGLTGRSPFRALALMPFAGYALLVTFARTAYAAAVVGCLVTMALIAVAALRGRLRLGALALGAVLVGAICSAALLGMKTDFMRHRLLALSSDYDERHANWLWGIAEFPAGWPGRLFGNGLGTFPRVHRAYAEPLHQAVDFVVRQDHGESYLTLGSGSTLYFGQKIAIEHRTKYDLELEIRTATPGARLEVLLCWKYLLYSDDCASTTFTPSGPNWTPVHAVLEINTAPLDRVQRWLPWFTDLAFYDPVLQTKVDLRNVRFLDPAGRNILVNGDFTRGTERWNFTSDDHLMWRIMNQSLMEISEEGWLGLAALSLLMALSFARACRAGIGGDPTGAAVAGALAAFLVSSMFDSLLDEPRVSTVFHLVCFAGLLMTTEAASEKLDRTSRSSPQD